MFLSCKGSLSPDYMDITILHFYQLIVQSWGGYVNNQRLRKKQWEHWSIHGRAREEDSDLSNGSLI